MTNAAFDDADVARQDNQDLEHQVFDLIVVQLWISLILLLERSKVSRSVTRGAIRSSSSCRAFQCQSDLEIFGGFHSRPIRMEAVLSLFLTWLVFFFN